MELKNTVLVSGKNALNVSISSRRTDDREVGDAFHASDGANDVVIDESDEMQCSQ